MLIAGLIGAGFISSNRSLKKGRFGGSVSEGNTAVGLSEQLCWVWMIYVVDIEQYLYLVPFVTDAEGTRFLKTIIPSRKATRFYQRRQSS